ncbi:hypothetical protein A3A76_01050 [Candidatus Woesebacteria bacterium RIFCSPLOWO2_01_FULL_39_23]|nr:MAG: hypothetical protein A3E41_02410 [Candidatus Woesebacteria bacterium RIFCSPHIGHO2_12_FULL_38_9]OGM63126.1 MAG: hypothetical protein A3A76_01050 [Candidatus Woesebacteria bacterium RIFCSPLOWO2_01_FULL_39_23]
MGVMSFVMYNGSKKELNLEGDSNYIYKDQAEKKMNKKEFGWPSNTAKYITAVPVDLTQIQSISKYRSCAGHIRDGYDFDRIREYDSSMKHYLYPIPMYQVTMDKVKLFAPFDGKVIQIDYEKNKVIPGRPHNGNGIHFSTLVDPNVKFVFGHLYFARDFKIGEEVTAGELIGYAAIGDKGTDFDIDLSGINKTNDDVEILGSAFDHMTDTVLAKFAKYGVTLENIKFSKEYRDVHPCGYYGTNKDRSDQCIGRINECWVQLKH